MWTPVFWWNFEELIIINICNSCAHCFQDGMCYWPAMIWRHVWAVCSWWFPCTSLLGRWAAAWHVEKWDSLLLKHGFLEHTPCISMIFPFKYHLFLLTSVFLKWSWNGFRRVPLKKKTLSTVPPTHTDPANSYQIWYCKFPTQKKKKLELKPPLLVTLWWITSKFTLIGI